MLQQLANSTNIARNIFGTQLTTVAQIREASNQLAENFDPTNPDSPFFSTGLGQVATLGGLLTVLVPFFILHTILMLACFFHQRKINHKRKAEHEQLLKDAISSQRPIVNLHNHNLRDPADQVPLRDRTHRSPTDTLPPAPATTACRRPTSRRWPRSRPTPTPIRRATPTSRWWRRCAVTASACRPGASLQTCAWWWTTTVR